MGTDQGKQEFQRRNDEMNIEADTLNKQMEKVSALKQNRKNISSELFKIRKAIEQNLSFDSETDNNRLIAAMLERIDVRPKDESRFARLDIILKTDATVKGVDLRNYSDSSEKRGKPANVHSVPTIHMISKECTLKRNHKKQVKTKIAPSFR